MSFTTISISTDKQSFKIPSIMEQLRSETREEHDYIESSMQIMKEDYSLNDYEQTLETFRGFYEPFEDRLKQFVELLPEDLDLNTRFKTPLLKNDLAAFFTTDQHRVCKELPEITNVYQALGAMYVLEGSTLGGQVITRHLQKVLGLGLSRFQFFNAYKEQTGTMWSRFKSIVNDFVEPDHNLEVIESARKTFRALRKWLDTSQPCR